MVLATHPARGQWTIVVSTGKKASSRENQENTNLLREKQILWMHYEDEQSKKSSSFFLFLEMGREGESEGEKHQWVVASWAPPTGDLAYNPGMCPAWE